MREFPPERVNGGWWYVVPWVIVDGERRPDIPDGVPFVAVDLHPHSHETALVKTPVPITGARTRFHSPALKAQDAGFNGLPRIRVGGQ